MPSRHDSKTFSTELKDSDPYLYRNDPRHLCCAQPSGCYFGVREPFATQDPAAHFKCKCKCGGEEADIDAPLFAGRTSLGAGIDAPALFMGITGEFCFAAPPTTICFFGPPTELWAKTGGQKAFPDRVKARTTPIARLSITHSFCTSTIES